LSTWVSPWTTARRKSVVGGEDQEPQASGDGAGDEGRQQERGWLMRTYQAINVGGILIAISSGGAIVLINRYEVSQPFDPSLFNRFDRWTGRVELCSSIYDNKTYCGSELNRRNDEAVNVQYRAANDVFLNLGYTQEEINNWPKFVLEGARNIVGNGGSQSAVSNFLKDQHVR
jgi:hypothetical protein